jgi:hypothetical protein
LSETCLPSGQDFVWNPAEKFPRERLVMCMRCCGYDAWTAADLRPRLSPYRHSLLSGKELEVRFREINGDIDNLLALSGSDAVWNGVISSQSRDVHTGDAPSAPLRTSSRLTQIAESMPGSATTDGPYDWKVPGPIINPNVINILRRDYGFAVEHLERKPYLHEPPTTMEEEYALAHDRLGSLLRKPNGWRIMSGDLWVEVLMHCHFPPVVIQHMMCIINEDPSVQVKYI